MLDTNQDGTLSLDELKSGVKNICLFEILQESHIESPDDEDCYNRILEMCDTDGDGKIDYLEFIQSAINHKSLANEQNIQQMFALFDINQDGKISAQELKQSFAQSQN